MLFVSGSYQKYQNGTLSNQLIDDGMGEGGGSVLGAGGWEEMSSIFADQ